MKTGRQRLHQNHSRRTSNSALNGGQSDNRAEGSRQDSEEVSTSEASHSLADGSFPRVQQCHVEEGIADSVDILFDGPWRSSASSELASVSDVIERKLSSDSIDSEILYSSLDNAPSLDDVFDVLDEMDPFGSGLQVNAPLIKPAPHPMPQNYRCNSVHQLPSGSLPYNSFQGFNFGLVKGLQSPSRGLITTMRRLCELLSKPRSDHLESVFVRLLNSTLNDMEDARQPQPKRPRRNNERLAVSKRQRKRPNKSASDAERSFESAKIGLSHSFTSKSQSLPAISARAGRYTETVDLTGLEESEKEQQHNCRDSQKEPFIALEDTMSAFMNTFTNIAPKQER